MYIPKVIGKDDQQYIFVQKCRHFYLYENWITRVRETFREDELVEYEEKRKTLPTKWEREEK